MNSKFDKHEVARSLADTRQTMMYLNLGASIVGWRNSSNGHSYEADCYTEALAALQATNFKSLAAAKKLINWNAA